MRRAVDLWATSTYWTERARGAIRHARYKERPDVRARRIKALETDRRRQVRQREDAAAMPFVVRRTSDDRLIGATRYFNVAAEHRRLEIGHTFYSQSVHRSAANTETKLLLLTHAFETLRCVGVELRTHFMNDTSRRAIERLGAKLDGILRSHQLMPDGSLRDTCVYSILGTEWPAVRNNLAFRLSHA